MDKRVIKWVGTNFGISLDSAQMLPKEADSVWVCFVRDGKRETQQILLKHQVYVKRLKEFFEDETIENITIVPIMNSNSIIIERKDLI